MYEREIHMKPLPNKYPTLLVAMLFLMVTSGNVMAGGLVDTSVERFLAADFTNSENITNPWWTLPASANFLYFAQDGEDCVWNLTEVLDHTTSAFVGAYAGTHARTVLDRGWVDQGCAKGLDFQAFIATHPAPEESTYDWYAQDSEKNIWYLGENTYDGDYGGSFTAGCDGAEAGIVLLGNPSKGDFYEQEFYEGEAEDWGKVVNLTKRNGWKLLKTKEWTPLEPGAVEHKFYRSKNGVGELFRIEELKGKTVIVELLARNITNPPPATGLPIRPIPSCPPFTQP